MEGSVNTDLNTFSTMMSMSSSRGRTKKTIFFTSAGGTLPLLSVNIFSTSCSLTMTKETNKMRKRVIKMFHNKKLCTEITCLEKGVLRYESKRPSEVFIPNYGLKPKESSCRPNGKMQQPQRHKNVKSTAALSGNTFIFQQGQISNS